MCVCAFVSAVFHVAACAICCAIEHHTIHVFSIICRDTSDCSFLRCWRHLCFCAIYFVCICVAVGNFVQIYFHYFGVKLVFVVVVISSFLLDQYRVSILPCRSKSEQATLSEYELSETFFEI